MKSCARQSRSALGSPVSKLPLTLRMAPTEIFRRPRYTTKFHARATFSATFPAADRSIRIYTPPLYTWERRQPDFLTGTKPGLFVAWHSFSSAATTIKYDKSLERWKLKLKLFRYCSDYHALAFIGKVSLFQPFSLAAIRMNDHQLVRIGFCCVYILWMKFYNFSHCFTRLLIANLSKKPKRERNRSVFAEIIVISKWFLVSAAFLAMLRFGGCDAGWCAQNMIHEMLLQHPPASL